MAFGLLIFLANKKNRYFLHRFYGLYYYLGTTGRTQINFTSCTAKTIAAGSLNIEIRKLKITHITGKKFLFFR